MMILKISSSENFKFLKTEDHLKNFTLHHIQLENGALHTKKVESHFQLQI